MSEEIISPKGLAGVVVDDSAISKVDVEINQLIYRGYDIQSLTIESFFLEVAYLLLYGELPKKKDLDAFLLFEKENREVPEKIYNLYKSVPKYAHPMDSLRLGVTMLGILDKENILGDINKEKIFQKAKNLLSKIPTLIANGYRISHGLPVVSPRKDLDYSENFLRMITGIDINDDDIVKTFDVTMILYAEHGFNASTFAGRVTASTLSDYYSAVASAIGTLKGPLHGGANEQVMYMLQEIGTKDKAQKYITDTLAKKDKIMGFGHRLYRTGDSRTPIIKDLGWKLARKLGNTKWHEIADVVEETMKQKKDIFPNLDFPSATAYYLMGIPIELYTPLFAASRITGWSAHLIEQFENNRLIRPSSNYTGPEKRAYVVIDKR